MSSFAPSSLSWVILICINVSKSPCRNCHGCVDICPEYFPKQCSRLEVSPHVCNGCSKQDSCTYERYYYIASYAHNVYMYTLLFRSCNLMLAILLKEKTQREVIIALNNLCEQLGIELFKLLFPVLLTDRGYRISLSRGIRMRFLWGNKDKSILLWSSMFMAERRSEKEPWIHKICYS